MTTDTANGTQSQTSQGLGKRTRRFLARDRRFWGWAAAGAVLYFVLGVLGLFPNLTFGAAGLLGGGLIYSLSSLFAGKGEREG